MYNPLLPFHLKFECYEMAYSSFLAKDVIQTDTEKSSKK